MIGWFVKYWRDYPSFMWWWDRVPERTKQMCKEDDKPDIMKMNRLQFALYMGFIHWKASLAK